MKTYFSQLCNYNYWANQQLHDFILENVPLESALKVVNSSFKNLNEHLFHINDAEYIWINRIKGNSVSDWPSKNEDKNQFPENLLSVSELFVDWLSFSKEADLYADCIYKNLEGKEFRNTNLEIIAHCMNHSTFHRGQIVTILRTLGEKGKLPQTDLIYYLRSRNT